MTERDVSHDAAAAAAAAAVRHMGPDERTAGETKLNELRATCYELRHGRRRRHSGARPRNK